MSHQLIALLLLKTASMLRAAPADWSQFRGPGGSGVSDAKGAPLNSINTLEGGRGVFNSSPTFEGNPAASAPTARSIAWGKVTARAKATVRLSPRHHRPERRG